MENWRHCPSKSNPADEVSRGLQSGRWLNGPEFLTREEDEWPAMPPAMRTVDSSDPEVKQTTLSAAAVVKTDLESHDEDDPMKMLVAHYSKRHSMLRGLAWILRVRRRLLNRDQQRSPRHEAADLREAELLVIKWLQQRNFPQEYAALSEGRNISRSSKLSKLCPQMSEVVIRVGGRLQNANISTEMKHSIVLPKEGHFTELVIQEAHEKKNRTLRTTASPG